MSKTVKQSVEDAGVSTPVSVLPPAVDHETFHPDRGSPSSISVEEDRFTILFVGSLKKTKGLEYLVRAVGDLDRPVQLVITTERDFPGADERWETIQAAIDEAGVQDSVKVLGIIDDMPQLIANSDVLVAPFLTTQGPSDYPLAVIEAMASGTPVIGSKMGGIEELLREERGYLTPPGDVSALTAALEKLVGATSEPRSDVARQFSKENFSEDAVVSSVEQMYKSRIQMINTS
jgi:glycosyltransferase involved in cell wall biosynthesis